MPGPLIPESSITTLLEVSSLNLHALVSMLLLSQVSIRGYRVVTLPTESQCCRPLVLIFHRTLTPVVSRDLIEFYDQNAKVASVAPNTSLSRD